MTQRIPWGLPHVFAFFLIISASGALNIASIGSVFRQAEYQPLGRLSVLLAFSLLAGGLFVLVTDLGRVDRLIITLIYSNFNSVFAWNVLVYQGFFALVVIYLWVMMSPKMQPFYRPAGDRRVHLAVGHDHRHRLGARLPGVARGVPLGHHGP